MLTLKSEPRGSWTADSPARMQKSIFRTALMQALQNFSMQLIGCHAQPHVICMADTVAYGASKKVSVFWKASSAHRQVGTGILRMHILLRRNIKVFLLGLSGCNSPVLGIGGGQIACCCMLEDRGSRISVLRLLSRVDPIQVCWLICLCTETFERRRC